MQTSSVKRQDATRWCALVSKRCARDLYAYRDRRVPQGTNATIYLPTGGGPESHPESCWERPVRLKSAERSRPPQPEPVAQMETLSGPMSSLIGLCKYPGPRREINRLPHSSRIMTLSIYRLQRKAAGYNAGLAHSPGVIVSCSLDCLRKADKDLFQPEEVRIIYMFLDAIHGIQRCDRARYIF